MRALFLNPPSFEDFDGGAGSRYQATREVRSFWYPTWLAYPAGMLPDSMVIDAPASGMGVKETLEAAKDFKLFVLYTSTPSLKNDAAIAALIKEQDPEAVVCFVGPHPSVLPEETLAALLSHKIRKGDLAAVLHEAIRCGIEKHGKRKGAVRPARKVAPRTAAPKNPAAIPAEVRRQVWERDGGRCSWAGPDGRRCDSRWQVEVDHIDAAGRGGAATLENLRLACKQHNLLHAERVYGREFMERYRKNESTTAGGSGPAWPMAREAQATG